MRTKLIVIMLSIATVCYGQNKRSDYTLDIDFLPSFISPGKLIIKSGTHPSIKLTIIKTGLTDSVTITSKNLAALTDFMKTYKFQIKGSIDTVGYRKGWLKGDTSSYPETTIGIDGINTKGAFIQNNNKKQFKFWAPKKDPENQKLIGILFYLMNKSFKNPIIINYTKNLETYFQLPKNN